MKVFISWSGDLSRQLAEALREWLPSVLQAIEPWMSAEDIEKGARWSADIARELEATKAGILCLTRSNIDSPWLNFEAGALSKTFDKALVSPYLLGLKPTDLKGPLVQFQATVANPIDTRRLIGTLNRALGKAGLPEKQLDKAFAAFWPELETYLGKLVNARVINQPLRSERQILEEILSLVRRLHEKDDYDYLERQLDECHDVINMLQDMVTEGLKRSPAPPSRRGLRGKPRSL